MSRSPSDAVRIPDKLYFKIGEVARITGLKPYVLRYWETEFPSIRPEKSKTNQRVYQRRDIENILMIKTLLYEEKFTIEGARTRLKELKSQKRDTDGDEASTILDEAPSSAQVGEYKDTLLMLRGRLERLKALLQREIGA